MINGTYIPRGGRSGTNHLMIGVQLIQKTIKAVNTFWIILDTCSTTSMRNNKYLIKNIQNSIDVDSLVLSTNGGKINFNRYADLFFSEY